MARQKKETEAIKEEKKQEPVLTEEQKQYGETKTELGLPLYEQVEIWKKDHGQVFKTGIQDDLYIWRKLKRTEYKEITLALNEEYGFEEANAQLKTWARQDEIAKTVLLYPEDADKAIEDAAGIATVIAQDCLVRSGFGALSEQV